MENNTFRFYDLIPYQNETATALTVEVLNETYPNVEFEAVETGTATYFIRVRGKYAEYISPQIMQRFLSETIRVYQIVGIILRNDHVELVP